MFKHSDLIVCYFDIGNFAICWCVKFGDGRNGGVCLDMREFSSFTVKYVLVLMPSSLFTGFTCSFTSILCHLFKKNL